MRITNKNFKLKHKKNKNMKKIHIYQLLELKKEAERIGIQSAMLCFDGHMAVWRLQFDLGTHTFTKYTIANPHDMWTTKFRNLHEYDFMIGYEKEYEEIAFQIERAKETWKQVREIARVNNIKWLDAPYNFLVNKSINVYVWSNNLCAPNFLFEVPSFSMTSIRSEGDFIANLLRDDYVCIDGGFYNIAVAQFPELCAYVNVSPKLIASILKFIEMPDVFDGDRAKNKILLHGSEQFLVEFNKELFLKRYENGDEYNFPYPLHNITTPHGGYPDFPYALWHSKRIELAERIKEIIKK